MASHMNKRIIKVFFFFFFFSQSILIIKKGGGGNLIYFTVDAHYISRVGIRSWCKGGFFLSRSLNQADFFLLFCQLHERCIFFFRKFIHLFRSTSKDDFFLFNTSYPSWKSDCASSGQSCFQFFKSEAPITFLSKFCFSNNQNLLLLLNFAKDRKKKLIFSFPLKFHNTTPTFFSRQHRLKVK